METTQEKIATHLKTQLEFIYGDRAEVVLPRLMTLLESYRGRLEPQLRTGWSEKDALLITYADSLTGKEPPLPLLHKFLKKHFPDALTFVHLLPFFPYSSDDGFSVIDYRRVRDDLGGWQDIEALSHDFHPVFDAVINHVSSESHYLKEYLAGNPDYADFFIALPPDTDTAAVVRPRNLPLLHDFDSVTGKKWLWTTFSRDQIDFNFANPAVLLEIIDILLFYAVQGAAMIRLDAVPFMWKRLGTSCSHLPENHAIVKLIRAVFDAIAPQVLLLSETNVPHRENVAYFGDGHDEAQMIYNFSLAPLILWSVLRENAEELSRWAGGVNKIGDEVTFLNITASHDGIGLRPTEGILSDADRAELCAIVKARGGEVSMKRNTDGSLSPYELNISYFDAVNPPDADEDSAIRRFMLTQTVPMAFIGLPGIYIHSLLGSRNWTDGVKATGRARSINRERLAVDAIEPELAESSSRRARIAAEFRRRLAIRATVPAFHPGTPQEVLSLDPRLFALRRQSEDGRAEIIALHNFSGQAVTCDLSAWGTAPRRDLLEGGRHVPAAVTVPPLTALWLAAEA